MIKSTRATIAMSVVISLSGALMLASLVAFVIIGRRHNAARSQEPFDVKSTLSSFIVSTVKTGNKSEL